MECREQTMRESILSINEHRSAVRVFFNHLAKCGGSTINAIAKEEYGEDFHRLSPSTETEELNKWLNKERCFITSEMGQANPANIIALLNDQGIRRIILSRDPVERFISFCGHSTRDRGKDVPGTAFWGMENSIKQPMSANAWMRSCLSRMQHILNDKDDSLKLDVSDGKWTFSIYSQWMLGSFQSYFDFNEGKLIPRGTGNQRRHISDWRSQPDVPSQINRFLNLFYSAWGSTDNIPLFINTLSKLGIFSPERSDKNLETKNSSKKAQENIPEQFEIKEDLIAEYYAMLPEEFWFHQLCSDLAIQHWEHLTSEEESKAVI